MTGSHQIGGNRCHCSKSTATSTTTHWGPHTRRHLVLSGGQKLLNLCYNRRHRLLAPPSLPRDSLASSLAAERIGYGMRAEGNDCRLRCSSSSSSRRRRRQHLVSHCNCGNEKYGLKGKGKSHLIRSQTKHNLPCGESVLLTVLLIFQLTLVLGFISRCHNCSVKSPYLD